MKYWLDKRSILVDLSKKYFSDPFFTDKLQFNFVDLYLEENLIATFEDCKNLNNQLYLDDKEPMGRYDKSCHVGKIDTNINSINIFSKKIQNCLDIISKSSEPIDGLIKLIIKKIIPITDTTFYKTRENGSGMSCHWLKGTVFLSTPKNTSVLIEELCLNIVHELGHQSLMIYQDIDPIINGGLKDQIYSSVRKTNRPAILSFHAHIAVYYMIFFLNDLLSSATELNNRTYLSNRLEKLNLDFLLGAEALSKTNWTELGLKLFRETIEQYETIRNAKY